jgi:hypothetical protein
MVLAVGTGCSLLVSTSGLDTGKGGSSDDASGSVSGLGPDGATDGSGGQTTDGDAAPAVWGTPSLVQHAGSSGDSLSFGAPTTPGNLLVAMTYTDATPSGAGWRTLAAGAGGAVYVWPNNPGGLTTFTTGGSCILLEFSGVPASVTLDSQAETSSFNSAMAAYEVAGKPPTTGGELELIYGNYVKAGGGYSIAIGPPWNYAETDKNADYAWWGVGTAAAPSASATFAPAGRGAVLLVTLRSD